MLTRRRVREALLEHVESGDIDTKQLTDRDVLELVLHLLIELRRHDSLNNTTAQPGD